MKRKSTREENLGCLFGLAGCIMGFLIGQRMHTAEVEAMLSADPDATIDFLPVLPVAGLIAGGFIAALVGMILDRLRPRDRRDV